MSSFVSSIRRLPRQLRVLSNSLYHFIKDYKKIGINSQKLWRAWRDGGTHRLKHALLDLTYPAAPPADAWQLYQQRLSTEVLPVLREEISAMTHSPVIAILVPTYNTDADMLQAMLDSVLEQIYPHWQLFFSDFS